MLWTFFALMSLVAIAFTVWPLARQFQTQRALTVAGVLFVGVASALLYNYTGSPDVPSGRSQQNQAQDLRTLIQSLTERLEREPDDITGWNMLGRSYMAVSDFDGAVDAFDKAIELESGQNPQTLVSLGFALTQGAGGAITPRASAAFENALAINPNYPEALFYGGLSAAEKGDTELAADRWETLLAGDPPAEVQNVLRQRIAEWRGEEASPPQMPEPDTAAAEEPAPSAEAPQVAQAGAPSGSEAAQPNAMAPAASSQPAGGSVDSDAIVAASISVSDAASAALPAEAVVFVIARDPAQPSPPIAVVRHRLSEFPMVIEMDDSNAMIAGRTLSAFDQIEIVARVSLSGSPVQSPGDWYGSAVLRPADGAAVDVSIDQRAE